MSEALPFELTSRVYDLLYQAKDYRAETEYLIALLAEHHDDARTVLDLGCGTGRHAENLIARGLEVTGVELSPQMATRARGVPGLDVVEGDVRDVRLNRRFDAVLALFHVVSYQTTVEDLQRTFATAAAHLGRGGLFIFDVWSTPAVLTQRPDERVRSFRNTDLEIVRTAHPVERPHESIVEVHYELEVTERRTGEVEELHETHVMRHLTQGEVELLARPSGFVVLRAEEYLTGAKPSESTWGVCYMLQRVAQ
jgi:SAM-dependent methyltransferase